MPNYTKSVQLEQIALELMNEFDDLAHLDDEGLRIAYQYSDQEKKNRDMIVHADTEVVKEKYREFMPYEFLITFYEPNCKDLDAEHLKRLMYHELKHVGFEGDSKFRVIPHNLEDFRECIDKWGVDWIRSKGDGDGSEEQ